MENHKILNEAYIVLGSIEYQVTILTNELKRLKHEKYKIIREISNCINAENDTTDYNTDPDSVPSG